jgi:hypothetical protein
MQISFTFLVSGQNSRKIVANLAKKQGSQKKRKHKQKGSIFYGKPRSRFYFGHSWQKYCSPGSHTPNSVWRT